MFTKQPRRESDEFSSLKLPHMKHAYKGISHSCTDVENTMKLALVRNFNRNPGVMISTEGLYS